MGVLQELNVALTQLHPNGWTFMQAFSAVYTALALRLTPITFLHFFHVMTHTSKPWVSLSSIPDKQIFKLVEIVDRGSTGIAKPTMSELLVLYNDNT